MIRSLIPFLLFFYQFGTIFLLQAIGNNALCSSNITDCTTCINESPQCTFCITSNSCMSTNSTNSCLSSTQNIDECTFDEAAKHPLQYLYIVIPCGIVALLFCFGSCYCYCYCCRKRKRKAGANLSESLISGRESSQEDQASKERIERAKKKRELYRKKYGEAISTYERSTTTSNPFLHTQPLEENTSMLGKIKNLFSSKGSSKQSTKTGNSFSSHYSSNDSL